MGRPRKQSTVEVVEVTGSEVDLAQKADMAGPAPVPTEIPKPVRNDELTTLQIENAKLRKKLEDLEMQTADLTDNNLDAMLTKFMKTDPTFGSRLYMSLDINNYIDFLGLNKNYIKKDPHGVPLPRMIALSVFPDTVNTANPTERIAPDMGVTLDSKGRSKLADKLRESEEPCVWQEIPTTIKDAIQMARREYLRKRLKGDREHLLRQVPSVE